MVPGRNGRPGRSPDVPHSGHQAGGRTAPHRDARHTRPARLSVWLGEALTGVTAARRMLSSAILAAQAAKVYCHRITDRRRWLRDTPAAGRVVARAPAS